MRVTAHHLIELAAASTTRAQQQVADATEVASTGLAVAVPSDDVTKWIGAARDRMREAISSGTGDAIATGRDRLQQTDGALANLSDVVSRARTLAVQGASDGLNASDRALLASQAQQLFSAALAAANTPAPDGSYLFAGAHNQVAPFDATGVFTGDTDVAAVATADGSRHDISTTGDVLTASHGVDVLPVIAQLGQALSANDPVAIQAALGKLSTAVNQLAAARAHNGAGMSSLSEADDARAKLETQLQITAAQLVEADAVGTASRLAQATQALQISQAVSAKVIASLGSSGS
jgi:flagellar hook-associated protein 3 FlgL